MNNDKIETDESMAQTLKPPPLPLNFSQRPTLPVIKKQEPLQKQYPPMRYRFYLIGVIIIVIIISAIVLISKPLQSNSMPEQRIFNLPPMVIPSDSVQSKPPDISPPTPSNSIKQPELKYIPKKIIVSEKPKEKDYGINDLIDPYNERIIYKL